MDDAFLAVVVIVSVLALVGALVALATSRGSYDQIGRGGTSLDEPPSSPAERDAEIRQYLAARNARRAARGEEPVDVEAEMRALTDPELEAEVRAMIEARNARRIARGQPPLDVDAEVSKRLHER